MRASTTRIFRLMAGAALAGLVLLVFLLFPAATSRADNVMQAGACDGYYYTVRTGDSWSVISRRSGVSIATLKLANPQALRRNDWVLIGERLCVPSKPATPQAGSTPIPVQPGGSWYLVKRGDTWNSVARAHDVPVRELWVANPDALNALQWLYVGQRLWIPGRATATPATAVTPAAPATPAPAASAAASATVTATVAVTAEAAVTPLAAAGTPAGTPAPTPARTATATAMVSPLATPAPAATATSVTSPPATAAPLPAVEATATPGATAETLPVIPDDCPEALDGYADAVLAHLNDAANTPGTLQTWLEACRVLTAGEQGVVIAPITASKSEDVIVTVTDPAAKPLSEKGQLLVYHKGADGYSLAHQVEGVGRIALLEAADINADKKVDLALSDTSCGAHTCFGTLSVLSWDGKAYADWIANEPTIAEPEITFKDVTTQGQGKEIIVHGGVIGSLGAGPQRAWTETYVSPRGGEYTRLSQDYDPSTCLYHKILDANAAFDAWALDGFNAAIELYKSALADKKAEACGTIEDEVATLQDFARFRLIVAAVAAGDAGDATALVAGIKHTGLRAAANTFLTSYATSGSVIQACRDITKLAETDTSTWDFLADWGYANPSLTAGELCPLN